MAKNYKQTTDQNGNSTKKTTRKKRRGFHPAANELIFEQRFRLLPLKSAKEFGSPRNIFPLRLSRNLKVARSHSPAG